jgi:hypothetical protein
MRKAFTAVLPDEPYKTTTKLNRSVECYYVGARYVLVRIEKSDGKYFCVDGYSETLEGLDSSRLTADQLQGEGHEQVVLDAEADTWLAAHLTHEYEHVSVPNYVETLSNGEVYEYVYDDTSSAVTQPYYTNDAYYKKETNSWIRPRMRTHAITRASFLEGVSSQIATIQEIVDRNVLAADRQADANTYLNFLKSIPTTYANIDHWKIKFPKYPNLQA